MKVAVTAASGALGRAIIQKLKNKIPQEKIIGIARTVEKAADLGVEIRKGDYDNKEDFKNAFHDIDTVLIVSGMDAPEKRIIQHSNIINAARESNVKKLVYTSIVGAEENNAFSPIVQSNRRTEKHF
jgi:NAD(P)H dehydrogenase (quinone)